LYNYLNYNNQKKPTHKLNFADLIKWCNENLKSVTNDDDGYLGAYQILVDDDGLSRSHEFNASIEERQFRLFFTTKRLIRIASIAILAHTDATYKLIWQGFPVLIVGTSDAYKRFHPIGLAVCTNERAADFQFLFEAVCFCLTDLGLPKPTSFDLVADAADAITNGFKAVFGDNFNRIMCWFHVEEAVKKRVKSVNIKNVLETTYKNFKCANQLVFSKQLVKSL
jgi:hypothetical protein